MSVTTTLMFSSSSHASSGVDVGTYLQGIPFQT